MSSPNVVRRVMNVELTSRLAETKNVIFLNNDPVLEWLKDDVKKNRLFSKDGERVTRKQYFDLERCQVEF